LTHPLWYPWRTGALIALLGGLLAQSAVLSLRAAESNADVADKAADSGVSKTTSGEAPPPAWSVRSDEPLHLLRQRASVRRLPNVSQTIQTGRENHHDAIESPDHPNVRRLPAPSDETSGSPLAATLARLVNKNVAEVGRSVAARQPAEVVPPADPAQTHGKAPFPVRPPDPALAGAEPLPPLDQELWSHGGSYLYAPEGDGAHLQLSEKQQEDRLRLPEDYRPPQPVTLFQDFLGADPIRYWPRLHWFGKDGFQWEPRFVGYGAYQIFGFALEEGDQVQSGIGHQLQIDLDFRVTGTERVHVQFRPVGEENTGGSFYQFTDPVGYVDNSTAAPDRYWLEGEIYSIFGGLLGDPFTPRDYHFIVGRFPFALQNQLLMNDEAIGVAVNKNTIRLGTLSNLNVQVFYFFDDIENSQPTSDVVGTNVSADYRHVFFELTAAHLNRSSRWQSDVNYAAVGATKFLGPVSLAGRVMAKWGDRHGTGDGYLFVIESNWTRAYDQGWLHRLGFEQGVYYANAFRATQGWEPIAGANFDRLRNAFAVDPLVSIARGATDDTTGVSAGVQLFRDHQDASLTPEIAYEAPGGQSVWGFGLQFQRKTSQRSFFDIRGVINWSDNDALQRHGVFASETILF